MPPLPEYKEDYQVLVSIIFVGTFLFSVISSKLQAFMGDFKVAVDLQDNLNQKIEWLEIYIMNHNKINNLPEN